MSPPLGRLRHRLTLEQPVRTPDGGGGASIDWDEIAEIWGAVEAVSGKERFEADRTSGQVSHVITIRYRSGVEPQMRFRLEPDIFEIAGILDKDGRKRFLHCQCERRDL